MKRLPGLASMFAVSGAALAQPSEFIVIDPAPGGVAVTEAYAVSTDGRVVVGRHRQVSGELSDGIRWTRDGGTQRLAPLHPSHFGSWSYAYSVSADGTTIGGLAGDFGRTPNPQPVIWHTAAVIAVGPMSSTSWAGVWALSGDGSIRAGKVGELAFVQNLAGPVHLLGPGAVAAMTPDGQSMVGTLLSNQGTPRAALWAPDLSSEFLNPDPNQSCQAISVSPDGGIIVGNSGVLGSTSARPFRWTRSDGMEGLGPFPGGQEATGPAIAVSADGLVIVGRHDLPSSTAFIWDASRGLRDLKEVLVTEFGLGHMLGGWTLRTATGISADGRTIVGNGDGPLGYRGWVVHLGYSCYANCDRSTTPALNAFDFHCFINRFSASDPYANCDRSTTPPVLNANDFVCFMNAYAAGCP
jgi:uncharacterized membrane protein